MAGRIRWNLEKVREVAKGKTQKELVAFCEGAYKWASKNKQLDNIGLVRNNVRWNLEKVREVAEGKTVRELKASGYGGAYTWARENKQLGNIRLIPDRRERWSLDKVRKVAEGKTSSELQISCKSAHAWAQRNKQLSNIGLIDSKVSLMNRWGKELVEDMDLPNKPEYRDETCKHEKVLPFDLAVFDHYEVKVLCEFQGEHHYRPVNFGGRSDKEAEEGFKDQQNKDQIKRDWCAERGIPLIEIKYTFRDKGKKAFKAELKRQLKKVGVFS